ncbi:GNAT family N-acetyltransferase [Sphingomonas rhizophila]|nr:GNAT family N-acetyltransferase [Sphingomonas rhizophila]
MSERRDMASPSLMPAPTIRHGGVGDLDGVIEVMNAAFDAQFGERWTRSQCAGILPMSGVELRIASLGASAPIGFSLMRTVADEAELLLIAVAPEARRRGIGQALLEDFIDRAIADGARHLHLEVRDGNPAIRMYHAAGFAVAGRRHEYYHGANGGHHDALTLRKTVES